MAVADRTMSVAPRPNSAAAVTVPLQPPDYLTGMRLINLLEHGRFFFKGSTADEHRRWPGVAVKRSSVVINLFYLKIFLCFSTEQSATYWA